MYTCVQNTQDAISQSMIQYCECPGCWVDCHGRVEVLFGVYGVVVRTFSNQVTS